MTQKSIIVRDNTVVPERANVAANGDIIYLYEEDLDISGGHHAISEEELSHLTPDMHNIYKQKKYRYKGIYCMRALDNTYPLFVAKNFEKHYLLNENSDELDTILFNSFLELTKKHLEGDSRNILVIPERICMKDHNGVSYDFIMKILDLLIDLGGKNYKIVENPYIIGKYGIETFSAKTKGTTQIEMAI